MHKKVTYKIVLDIEQDAWNWRDAYNKSSHGMDWGKLMPVEVREQLGGKSDDEADKYLISYLKKKYVDERDTTARRKQFIESEFEQKFIPGCAKITEMMGKPIHTEEFTLFLTTFSRGPYNPAMGYVWIILGHRDPFASFFT